MEFNNHDLYDFTSKLNHYKKAKKIARHKTVNIGQKTLKEKKLNGYVIKVLSDLPVVEKISEAKGKDFFNTMMQRHKRRGFK